MELNLTVQPPSSQAVDVDIRVDGSRPISDVVEALVKATGVPHSLAPQMNLYIPSRNLWLNSEMIIEKAGLKIGEVVVLGRNTTPLDGASSSATIGDVAEKNNFNRNSKHTTGISTYELCIISGIQNGERLPLYKTTLVIIDYDGKVRTLEQSVEMRANFGEFDIVKTPPKSKFTKTSTISNREDRNFVGINSDDASAFLVEAEGKLFVEPISADTNIEMRKLTSRTQIDEHAMIISSNTQFQIRPRPVESSLPISNRGIVGINRPPRDMQPPKEKVLTIEAPPRAIAKSRISPVMMILPMFMGVAMAIFLKNILFLGMAFFSPMMMAGNAFENKRNGKKEFKAGKAKYIADIEKAVIGLRQGRREELAIRRVVWPDATDCISRIVDSRHDLWDRRRDDVDYLSFRVGVGDQVALVSAEIEAGGLEDLRDFGEKKLRRSDPIHLSPLVVSLPNHGAIGLVGDRKYTLGVLQWIMLQTISLHSHRDVSLCGALPTSFAEDFEYLKWLPHVRYGGAEVDEPTFAFGEVKSVVLFQKIRALIESRNAKSTHGYFNDNVIPPSVVCIVDETVVRDRTSIDAILKTGPAVGVYTIFLSSQFRDLPGECKAIIDVAEPNPSGNDVSIAFPGTGRAPTVFNRESVNRAKLDEVAQRLAPMRDVTASVSGGGGGSLPKKVRLLDILNLEKPAPETIIEKWKNSPESLQAILGVTVDGTMNIDLRLDGPHGLIAGTTGSGKSELLQTFVASMATNYSPQKVNFLFVDYKGGTAFAECSVIPHSVGMVTDLDEYLAQRVLISLNAELKRREALLREYSCKDLFVFEKRFPDVCPPSLIIVIDEFAALAREVPDFVEGVVDIAQRGRSLGLHLILATQRPAGVVNDNIRANTNLRIALRIADSSDSTDVIGTDEAARIPRSIPGRAFVRMGPSDLTAFQSGYGGDFTIDLGVRNDGEKNDDENSIEDFSSRSPLIVEPFTMLGLLDVEEESDIEVLEKVENLDETLAKTDLSYLCNVILQAAFQLKLPEPRQPWKETLPKVLTLAEAGDISLLNENDKGRKFILGKLDIPAKQDQKIIAHDFESDGNIFIYGTSSSGKTTALRSIAMSLAVSSSPSELNIYGLDCASGGLDSLKELPHTIAVLGTRDAEGVGHFLARISREVEARKELFRTSGVSTMGEYRTRLRNNGDETKGALPRIVILLDSFAGYVASFDKIEYGAWVDAIQRIIADGRPLGIHIIVTADRRGAIPFNMAGLVETKLILKMSDPDELSSLGVPTKIAKEIKLSPGRAMFKNELELQIPIVSNNPEGSAQVLQIQKIAQYLTSLHGDSHIVKAASLPEALALSSLPQDIRENHVSLGAMVSEEGLVAAAVDFSRGNFVISGPRNSGRSVALTTLIRSHQAKNDGSFSFIFTPRPNFISTIEGITNVAVGAQACEAQLHEIIAGIEALGEDIPEIYFFIDDCEDLADGGFATTMEIMIRELKQDLHVIAAGDPSAFSRAYSGWLAEAKRPKSGLLLKPDPQADGEITGVKIKALPGQIFPPGRGYLCLDRQAVLIQVAI